MPYKNILKSLCGIIFLGIPHSGAAIARWGDWIATALGLTGLVSVTLLDVLQNDNEVLICSR